MPANHDAGQSANPVRGQHHRENGNTEAHEALVLVAQRPFGQTLNEFQESFEGREELTGHSPARSVLLRRARGGENDDGDHESSEQR